MHEDATQQLLREILREMREQAARSESFGHFLNSQNTETAKMTVKMENFAEQMEHVADQQQKIAAMSERLAVVEAKFPQQEKFEQRFTDQSRHIQTLSITSGVALLGVAVAIFAALSQYFGKH